MMILPATHGHGPLDWTLSWLPLGNPSIRIEEFLDGETYVVRAELPGVDPVRQIQVAVVHGELRIRSERENPAAGPDQLPVERHDRGHSEFHYGASFRAVPLPPGTRADLVTARYDRGILEVKVPLAEPESAWRDIPVQVVEPATARN